MRGTLVSRPINYWIEWAFALLVIAGGVNSIVHILVHGYLPAPFFYETWDTFGDFFNPAFWSRQPGVYDTWGSIYFPLSLLIVRSIGIEKCYDEFQFGFVARHCDYLSIAIILAVFILNLFLTWRFFRKIAPETAPMRTICVALGLPMLFTLERGNLLLLAYTCILLSLGPFLRSAWTRWLLAGVAINLKIYLIAAFVPLLLRGRWLRVEGVLLSAVVVYLVSFALYGRGTPIELYNNLVDFSRNPPGSILALWYSNTYTPLTLLMDNETVPLVIIFGSDIAELAINLIRALTISTQLVIILAAVSIWLKPSKFTNFRTISLGLCLAFVTSEAGAYSTIVLLPFVLAEKWEGLGRIWAIIACYILCIPFEIQLEPIAEGAFHLYFQNRTAIIEQSVNLGPFVRPLLYASIGWALALATLNEFRRDYMHRSSESEKPLPLRGV